MKKLQKSLKTLKKIKTLKSVDKEGTDVVKDIYEKMIN